MPTQVAQQAYTLIAYAGAALALRLVVAELAFRRTRRLHFTTNAQALLTSSMRRQRVGVLPERNRSMERQFIQGLSNADLRMMSLIILSILLTWPASQRLLRHTIAARDAGF